MSDESNAFAFPVPAAFVQTLVALTAKRVLDQLTPLVAAGAPMWMTTAEASDYTRIPYETFRKLAAERTVPLHKRGSRNLFNRDELDRWLLDDGQAPTRARRAA